MREKGISFNENFYQGFPIVNVESPSSEVRKLYKLIKSKKAEFSDLYSELFNNDFEIDGFNIDRCSAKLRRKIIHRDKKGKPLEFDGYYIVQALDGGNLKLLVNGNKVHIKRQ